MSRWLFLDDGQGSGAENMAADEFILKIVRESDIGAILRLYSFDPPAVTVGYHQDPGNVLDLASLRRDRIPLVRRITGGRALLHDDEITYCLAASVDGGVFQSNLRERFTAVSEALKDALNICGVKARISRGRREPGGGEMTSPCLASVSQHEITAGGRKIVASAQRSCGPVFIQHGSILLDGGAKKISEYLKGDWGDFDRHVTSIKKETGTNPGYSRCAEVLKEAFSAKFRVKFRDLKLSGGDRSYIKAAARKKAAEF
ncbi:MAG: lipoate--protein ligase family protein [Candidatus Krumholzibacteriota bacterium]|nr:lipoate--protein ligase family protein [Candidatus Krumholzibacteriota bacterium]